MWEVFRNEISRFSLLIFAALVFFELFWLYFDAWKIRKITKTLPLLVGLLILSLSFLMQGLNLETGVLKSVWLTYFTHIYLYLRVIAYVLVLAGLFMTPIEERPKI